MPTLKKVPEKAPGYNREAHAAGLLLPYILLPPGYTPLRAFFCNCLLISRFCMQKRISEEKLRSSVFRLRLPAPPFCVSVSFYGAGRVHQNHIQEAGRRSAGTPLSVFSDWRNDCAPSRLRSAVLSLPSHPHPLFHFPNSRPD